VLLRLRPNCTILRAQAGIIGSTALLPQLLTWAWSHASPAFSAYDICPMYICFKNINNDFLEHTIVYEQIYNRHHYHMVARRLPRSTEDHGGSVAHVTAPSYSRTLMVSTPPLFRSSMFILWKHSFPSGHSNSRVELAIISLDSNGLIETVAVA